MTLNSEEFSLHSKLTIQLSHQLIYKYWLLGVSVNQSLYHQLIPFEVYKQKETDYCFFATTTTLINETSPLKISVIFWGKATMDFLVLISF